MTNKWTHAWLVIGLLISAPQGSHADQDPYLIKNCSLPKTLQNIYEPELDGFRPSFPIEVIISEDLPASWKIQTIAALEEWDRFSRVSLGLDFFILSKDPLPEFAQRKDPAVGIEKPITRDCSILAVVSDVIPRAHAQTSASVRTSRGSNGLPIPARPKKVQQLIRISTDSGFGQIPEDSPSIESVVLHELGHALGLDHTCDFMWTIPSVNCTDPSFGPDLPLIHPSVMFPGLAITSAVDTNGKPIPPIQYETKNRLTPLDMMRVYCLYSKK